MTLVNGWKTWWRQYSTWLLAVGSTAATFAPELSEVLIYVWSIIPMDIKVVFDPQVVKYTGYAIAILAIPAKLIRQPKLHEEVNGSAKA